MIFISKILIKNINIINPNEDILFNHNLLINDKHIETISRKKIRVNKDKVKIIEGKDQFLLPGFIDAHNHIMANGFHKVDNMNNPLALHFYQALANMEVTLKAGITTLRDCGLADPGVKLAAEKKLFLSPKLFVSTTPLSITGGHYDFFLNSGHDMELLYPGMPSAVCDGVEGVIKKTREVLRTRPDFIKVMASGGVISDHDSPKSPQFNKKELKAILCEVKSRDLKVSAHAHSLKGIENCVDVGIDSIEHGTFIDKKTSIKMKEKDLTLVPTLLVIDTLNKDSSLDDLKKEKVKGLSKVHKENTKTAYECGVNILMGTDSGVIAHGNNLKELELLAEIGMSEMEAISAGTIDAANFMGLGDKIGSLHNGKIADMILTKDNPLDNIQSLSDSNNIKLVIQDGIIVKE